MDATKPIDQELVSLLPSWIREVKVKVNEIEGLIDPPNPAVNNLIIAAGSTSLAVDVDLSTSYFEIVFASAIGPVTIANIWGGTDGQVKIFIFVDALIDILDGTKSGGDIYLNQLPALSTYDAQVGDVIALINIGGDGATEFGYWKEIFRQTAVK